MEAKGAISLQFWAATTIISTQTIITHVGDRIRIINVTGRKGPTSHFSKYINVKMYPKKSHNLLENRVEWEINKTKEVWNYLLATFMQQNVHAMQIKWHVLICLHSVACQTNWIIFPNILAK